MQVDSFSKIQLAIFDCFETKIPKINKKDAILYKLRKKINKKEADVRKVTEKNSEKILFEYNSLLEQLERQRKESLNADIPSFFNECAGKAKEISKKGLPTNIPSLKVSHPTKFIHGLSPYGGVYVTTNLGYKNYYLTTESLQSDYYDLSHRNGILITYSRFLMFKIDNETIYEKIEKNDYAWLSEFNRSKAQLQSWQDGLSLWVAKTEDIKNASRLKQTYFPLSDGSYHITAPLFSSSICQAIYDKVRFITFSQENKKLRAAKNNNKYAEGVLVEYPNFAIMNFGGTQPQNISAGNFERHGEAFLLPCSPPHWQSNLKPPITKVSLYEDEFDRRAWKIAKDLQLYLAKLQKKKGNMEIRNHVTQLVYQIIDALLGYVAEIHSLEAQAGWSESDCKLKVSHQIFLDLHRKDEQFQLDRASGEWQKEVCKDFGLWLNKKLESKTMVFAKIESSHWAKLLARQLREFEHDIKRAKEVSA